MNRLAAWRAVALAAGVWICSAALAMHTGGETAGSGTSQGNATTDGAAQSADPHSLPFWNASLPLEQRVADLVARLTLEEKTSQTMHVAPAIERLGIPPYTWVNECLHGVAAAGRATSFPQAIGLGATWDPALIGQVASAISDEARAKVNHGDTRDNKTQPCGLDYWSPNINIFRDPRWGRGQETYGEDPYLTSRIGVAFVRGLQGNDAKYLKVIATPKHYAVHSGPEPLRHRFDAQVSARDLWQTYLPHFEACVREGGAWSIMCAYNRDNQVACCANPMLLEDVLREKWGFGGYVVSDCGAIDDIYKNHQVVNTAEQAAALSMRGGCDLNCGHTNAFLVSAVKQGLIAESEIDRSVKRLFEARLRLGLFDPPDQVPFTKIPYSTLESEQNHALARKAARESMVLLKNEGGLLPLSKDLRSIALVGPNADTTDVLLGNYHGWPSHIITPVEGLKQAVGAKAKVTYAKGCNIRSLDAPGEVIPSSALRPLGDDAGARGLEAEYYNNEELSGTAVLSRVDAQVDFDWKRGAPAEGVHAQSFSVRWSGKVVAPASGLFWFTVSGDDGYRLMINGKQVIENWCVHLGQSSSAPVQMESGRSYDVVLEYFQRVANSTISLRWTPPDVSPFDDALKAANQSELIIACMGLSTELEREGRDRSEIELPEVQQHLLRALASTGKPIVLVLINGSPLAINWENEHLPAILEAWYPGQESGAALADVLLGDYNPAGRLPVTFYKSLAQVPPFEDYDMSRGRTFRFLREEPLYAFGYGLNYTTFEYSNREVAPATARTGENIAVRAMVQNTGKRAGDEVAQLYLSHQPGGSGIPLRELAGIRRLSLQPGEQKQVEFTLTPRELLQVAEDGSRAEKAGAVEVWIGGGQPSPAHVAGETTDSRMLLRISGPDFPIQ